MAKRAAKRPAALDNGLRRRVIVENLYPEIDAGRFPAKRTVGETVQVAADVHADLIVLASGLVLRWERVVNIASRQLERHFIGSGERFEPTAQHPADKQDQYDTAQDAACQ